MLSLDGCMDMEKRMRQCLAEGTCRECKVWEDKITKTNDDEDGVTEDNGNNGGKNKDKNKQGSDAPGGNTKAAKQKDKEKKEQEAAAAAAKQNESMSNGTNPADVITVEESPAPPTQSPTSQPKHQPTTSDPTYSPTEDPSLIGCSGEPCHISNNIKNIVFEFCRSADGICGTGPQYCNSAAIWTASCQSDGNHNVYDTTIPTTYYPTIAMPVMPPEGLQAAGGSANKYDDASTSLMTSAKETPQGVRPPLRRTQRPTAEPSPDPAPRPLSAAGQFGVVPTSITGPSAAAAANSNGKITETPPNSSSHANQFATATHSKGRNNGQATATSARPKPDAASPADSPVGSPEGEGVSSASKFGGMTNWANTKLDYPPTVSPVVVTSSPVDASNAPTHLPTLLPTKKPVQTTNIADTLHDQSKELNQKSTVIVETVPETELENQHSSGSSSTNESDVSDTFNPPASLREDISVDSSTVAKASRYTALGDDSYLFFPMDDVTISRSFPSSNFGSEPSIVVDMLDGDAALLRFDLSIVGDSVIEKATLRLTSHSEDGVGGSAGVYYIQPTVNGWTEESVTYSTAPKTDGSLFASVASLRNSEDDANNNQYEMDVTDVAANHIISFRVIGTDRVRKEFCSKESSEANDAPLILVKLDSLNSELVRDTIILPTKQKPMVAKVTAGNSNDQSPTPSASSSGSIFGHIWLDRNADGVKESNEPGLRGILVDLYQCDDDTWLEGTRSAPGGEYIFEDLNGEGRYYVVVTTVSAEYGFAEKASAGSDSHARVSDVDPATGRGDCLDLSSTSNATGNQHIISASVNAGIIKKSMPLVTANEALDEVATTLDSPTVVASSDSDGESNDSSNHNCRGRACTEGGGYCRSKFNFCGLGEEYCNEDSQWTAECGTPSPTYPPSAEPTTGPPTFLHDPNVHCVGEPCYDEGDGTWCRSEIGYCGSGPLYCNSESSWSPDCNGVTGDSLPAPPTKSPSNPYSTTGAPIALKMGQVVATLAPPTPSPIEDITMFSQFASPTLPFIATPKQTGVGATSLNSQGTVKSEDEQSVSFLTDTSLPANTELSSSGREGPTTKKAMENDVRGDEPWYVRYSDVRPMPHNIGSRPIPGIVSALCFVASTLIRLL